MSRATPASTEAREAFYKAIEPESMRALWPVMGAIITPEPNSGCQPVMWKYDTVRARLMEAAGLITAKEAERRYSDRPVQEKCGLFRERRGKG